MSSCRAQRPIFFFIYPIFLLRAPPLSHLKMCSVLLLRAAPEQFRDSYFAARSAPTFLKYNVLLLLAAPKQFLTR